MFSMLRLFVFDLLPIFLYSLAAKFIDFVIFLDLTVNVRLIFHPQGLKLDRQSGRKCYLLGAMDLSIAWGNDTRYWEWGHIPESRSSSLSMLGFFL
ncbi:putative phloem protein [Helianthus annuus]|uniref:Phloem protein n=1 Tax=Helianthus annuus TaxID=4232 RepID=A0A9K3H458_HELAN|nr:putative phloem protein [Helianthus annuus]KAJ0452009.1 putative phloem protein [Helianthus annuus]KAJ0456742.1 putative phloem protein [Helianthus annuus]KAJ0473893.1 putative phloem protein [Helianthus annuus]KAJ0649470.1 putative phloem protein [Helianthus annuus]